ncbi:hypothetical protein Poli38472_007146 [Pythium oligandrum]|uniref:Short chain dehydrogenase n=1 Tax=Pythium oligandrum TaxID=41045 RepID=A0A8K1C970_PYTOL|nr:hypothetical protein Poli38472_007146 [Pythium oligandrum]|eukprot:TMW59001.1 hypothetical protein Poli38472_007146 [Pythium oligandrum]
MVSTVLITGSSRGIGLALVKQFQAAGWNVIGAVRNPATSEKLQALSPYKIVQLDTADEESIERAANELNGQAIDLLINNAGICADEEYATMTKEAMMRQFEVNAVGPFLVSRTFVPHLQAAVTINGRAKLVHISTKLSSISLNDGTRGWPGYRMSKSALNMMHMSLTHEFNPLKVACAVVCPGYVATDFNLYRGLLQVDDSAAAVAKVIAAFSFEDTGKFFNNQGEIFPW